MTPSARICSRPSPITRQGLAELFRRLLPIARHCEYTKDDLTSHDCTAMMHTELFDKWTEISAIADVLLAKEQVDCVQNLIARLQRCHRANVQQGVLSGLVCCIIEDLLRPFEAMAVVGRGGSSVTASAEPGEEDVGELDRSGEPPSLLTASDIYSWRKDSNLKCVRYQN